MRFSKAVVWVRMTYTIIKQNECVYFEQRPHYLMAELVQKVMYEREDKKRLA